MAAFVAVSLVGVAASYAQTYFTGWTGERMLADLRNHLFRHLQRLSLGFYERNRAGVLISRLTNDVEALDQLVTDGVTSLIQNTLLLTGAAVLMFWLSWELALATFTIIPFLIVATTIFRKKSSRSYRLVRETLGQVTATLAEDIAGVRVLQAFTREKAARENFRRVGEDYRISNQQTVIQNALYFPFVDLLSSIATAIILGYGAYLVFDGSTTIGVMTAFLGYATMFFDPVQQLSQLYSTFLSAVAALDKIMDVLEQEPQITDADDAVELPTVKGRVTFDHVRFSYGTGPGGAARDRPRRAGRVDRRARRPHRRRQVDDREADRPLLRPDRGSDLVDGIDLRQAAAGVAPPAARDRAAGGLPLRRHGRREHRVRPARGRP